MRTFKQKLDCFLFRKVVNWLYPLYVRPKYGYSSYFRILKRYAFNQKVLRINGRVKWPVDRTSLVIYSDRIKKGYMCDPGDNLGNYIQANNGIVFGNNVEIGPGVKIISSNHCENDFSKVEKSEPIVIGNNVWIGANAVILASVVIGNNVVIGAGSIVTRDIPSNCVAVGNPCKVIRDKEVYQGDLDVEMNR